MVFFIPGVMNKKMENNVHDQDIIQDFIEHINEKEFPCVAAKAALANEQVKCMVAGHMACPHDDNAILHFIYDFVDDFRKQDSLYHSAVILFQQPLQLDEKMFEQFLWLRLQALSDMDAENFNYDERVDRDPGSPEFSYSLKEEAFFVIGMHPSSSRKARQFKYPAIIFNPHIQFEELRHHGKYEPMQKAIRNRDTLYSGSVNPMLSDFGEMSETFQYSGKKYNEHWKCPLKINHGKIKHYSTT